MCEKACAASAAAYAAAYVGQTVEVLLETPTGDGTVTGHTATYLTVHTTTDRPSGSLISARITGADGDTLRGIEAET